jgi:hypothetical protein
MEHFEIDSLGAQRPSWADYDMPRIISLGCFLYYTKIASSTSIFTLNPANAVLLATQDFKRTVVSLILKTLYNAVDSVKTALPQSSAFAKDNYKSPLPLFYQCWIQVISA